MIASVTGADRLRSRFRDLEGRASGKEKHPVSSATKNDGAGRQSGKPAMSARMKMILTGLGVAAFVVVGVFLIFQFARTERARALRQWQSRMSIVIDSRFADIERWLNGQTEDLRGIADNASVQLYLTVFHQAAGNDGADAQAELGYLGNLLRVVADRAGFRADDTGPRVGANIAKEGTHGLALIDLDYEYIVHTDNFPQIKGPIRAFLDGTEKGVSAVSDIFLNADGTPSMAFLVPVYAIQGDESAESQLGYVLGVKEIGDDLYPLLKQPGATEETAETLIVRQTRNQIDYLTPRGGGGVGPLEKPLAVDTPDLAASWAIRTVGGFAVKTDYDGNEVLAISRSFGQMPWTLLYKIDTGEALAESEARLRLLMIVFAVIIVLVLIGMLALWYYGTSQRAAEAAHKFEGLANRFQGQRNFMHLVTDSQPNSIVILDEDGHYRWFNKTALDMARMDRKDIFDKHVSAILGPIEGKRIAGWAKEALTKAEPLTVTHEMELDNAGAKVYRSDFQPLPPREDFPPGVLMVSQDITESVSERERREAAMRQLVGTLVSVVDRRDPYSANHSVRVGAVARAIAGEMNLDDALTETVAIAGSLMNLGKIEVPGDILTKRGGLTPQETALVQKSVLTSAEMVANVDFDGPVYDTLRQLQEHFDGSGAPDGLSGMDIIITARIGAVANAFVGMVSARAWRSGMSFDKALDILLGDGNTRYDRAVVVALAHHLDNRGGRDAWKNFGDPPEKDGGAPAPTWDRPA